MIEQLGLLSPRGATFDPALDADRLGRQARAVWEAMRDGSWHTLRSLSDATGAPESSASARLRDLRRLGLTVERERVAAAGLWRYRVVV